MLRDTLLSTETVFGVLFALVAIFLLATFVRRRALARGKPLVPCAMRDTAHPRWHLGLARYGSTGLDFYSLGGFSVRPRHRWQRSELALGRPDALRVRPVILPADSVYVLAEYDGRSFELALGRGAYTALRSWLEASPPGIDVNVA